MRWGPWAHRRRVSLYPAIATRTPSMTNCTASAASSTPRMREATDVAVLPSRLPMRPASSNTMKHSSILAAMTPSSKPSRSGSPPLRPDNSTLAVMAPGPAISGMASGKAAILRTRSSMACSAVSVWRTTRTPNTISEAIENSSKPPAMRNAGSEIDSMRNSQSPASALPARIAAAIRQARSATLRRDAAGKSCVMAMKDGTSPIGSSTTRIVTRAETVNSRGMNCFCLQAHRAQASRASSNFTKD